MSAETNKALTRRVVEEVWSRGNLDIVDETYATDWALHDPAAPGVGGSEGMKQLVAMYRTAFPDLHMSVEDQIVEGDKVVSRWKSIGTHQGELMGIPPIGLRGSEVIGIFIDRIVDGKIVESWANWDTLGMLQNIGVIPPMGQSAG